MTIKAVAYLRVSGASQLNGEGFGRQRETIAAYAAANGFELTGEYEERAVPGKTEFQQRPAFMDMLCDLEANCCRTIIVERLDRLARDLLVQETIIADLRKRGFELRSAREPDLMANDPGRKLMRQIFGAIAEYEKDLIVSKLAHARASVRAKGGFSGGNIPYGYCPRRATEEQIVRANSERITAQYIRQLRAQGLTLDAICRTITAEGHQARGGRPWQLSSIRRIARGEG